MVSKITKLIVTFLGTGYSKICPGTVASIATLPLWFLIVLAINYLQIYNPIFIIALIILSIYIIGYIHVKKYVTEKNLDDPKEVVIDEVVGQLISFFIPLFHVYFLSKTDVQLFTSKHDILISFLIMIFPIILFRFFDIKKPWVIGKIDSNIKNAIGIMLDDIVGGVFAGITDLIIIIITIKLL